MKILQKVYLGPDGSFSQAALGAAFKEFLPGEEWKESGSMQVGDNKEIVPAFIVSQSASLACLAVHTRAQARLTASFEQMMELVGKGIDFRILGAIEIPISFALLAREGVIEPTGIVSHARGIGACKGFCEMLGVLTEAVGSNSLAAQMVAMEQKYGSFGALAPVECAKVYGLKVIKLQCEDKPARTMFYILGKDVDVEPCVNDEWRVFLVFDIADKEGSLLNVLRPIGEAGINIKHIHSVGESDDRYQFCLELGGCRTNLPKLARALFSIGEATTKLFVGGPFPVVRL